MNPTVDNPTRRRSALDHDGSQAILYSANVQIDRGRPYFVSGVFYIHVDGNVILSLHNARRDGVGRRAPPTVLHRLREVVFAYEERTCWTCLRTQFVGPDNEKCPACDGVGVHRG